MKRIISVLFFFLLAGNYVANAQKFHFGLNIAPGIAWIKPDTKGFDNDGVKLAFSYGIITEFAFNQNQNYALATGLQVSYRGGKISNLDSIVVGNGFKPVNSKTKLTLQYLELPVTLKMKTNEIGAFKYFGQFGLLPAFNIKATSVNDNGFNITNENIKSDINAFSASLLVALGFEYNLVGNTSLVVSAAFNNGLTDVLDNKDVKAISNLINLNVGILF